MHSLPDNETRTRLLDVAEELFSTRGYTAVRLRDIANALGMRHASLYYYAPGGKEELYLEVMERTMRRHHAGLERAIAEAGSEFRAQIYAVVDWLAAQPPLDVVRMNQADMPELAPDKAERLMVLAYDSLSLPIGQAIRQAMDAGQITVPDVDLAALGLVSLIESVHAIPQAYAGGDLARIGRQFADMLLDGWLRR
jgi:AcrR family transcriptional regulator